MDAQSVINACAHLHGNWQGRKQTEVEPCRGDLLQIGGIAKEREDLLARAWQTQLGLERGFAHNLPDSKPGFKAARPQRTPATERFKHRKCTISCQKKPKPNRHAQCKPGPHKQNHGDKPSEYPPFIVDIRGEQFHYFSLYRLSWNHCPVPLLQHFQKLT